MASVTMCMCECGCDGCHSLSIDPSFHLLYVPCMVPLISLFGTDTTGVSFVPSVGSHLVIQIKWTAVCFLWFIVL